MTKLYHVRYRDVMRHKGAEPPRPHDYCRLPGKAQDRSERRQTIYLFDLHPIIWARCAPAKFQQYVGFTEILGWQRVEEDEALACQRAITELGSPYNYERGISTLENCLRRLGEYTALRDDPKPPSGVLRSDIEGWILLEQHNREILETAISKALS